MLFFKRLKRALSIAFLDPLLFLSILPSKLKVIFISRKAPFNHKVAGGRVFKFDFSFDPAILSMYTGTYEFDPVRAMKRLLREGDTFIDVGANIGYLSTVGLGLVGKSGSVHSFEPVKKYFLRLKEAKELNGSFDFNVNQFALGDKEERSRISITNLSNIGWNTIVPGLMDDRSTGETQDIEVRRLDKYINENRLKRISLIKIDTEGYEFPVLRGLSGFFPQADKLPAIICEIAPDAYRLPGNKLEELHEYITGFGYASFDLNNPGKQVELAGLKETTNVFFLPLNKKNGHH